MGLVGSEPGSRGSDQREDHDVAGSEPENRRADERAFAETLVAWFLAGLAASWVAVWVFGSYLGRNVFSAISYWGDDRWGDDRPCGLQLPWTLGVHTFGDYALPWAWVSVGAPWSGVACPPSNYPPLPMLGFEALSRLPYGVGFFLYMALLASAMLAPFWWATRGAGWRPRIGIFGLVVMSAPMTMVIDRGNNVGFLVPPLMLFVWGWVRKRWVHVALGVSAATAIKLYPAMFYVVLAANRKWRLLTLAGLATALATFALWAVFPGSLPEAIRGFLGSATLFSEPTAENVGNRNYSLLGGLVPMAAEIPGSFGAAFVSWLLAHPWVPGGLYLLGCFALIVVTKQPTLTTISLTLAGLQLVPPVNFRYYSVFAIVVAALIARSFFVGDFRLRLPTGILASGRSALLITSLLVTLLPLPLLRPGVDSYFPMQTVIAAFWLLLLIVELVAAVLGGGQVKQELHHSKGRHPTTS